MILIGANFDLEELLITHRSMKDLLKIFISCTLYWFVFQISAQGHFTWNPACGFGALQKFRVSKTARAAEAIQQLLGWSNFKVLSETSLPGEFRIVRDPFLHIKFGQYFCLAVIHPANHDFLSFMQSGLQKTSSVALELENPLWTTLYYRCLGNVIVEVGLFNLALFVGSFPCCFPRFS